MNVALFGDSQAEGLNLPLQELLGDELVETFALRGQGTSVVASRIARTYEPYGSSFDVAIVVLGGNDTAGAHYPETLAMAAGVFRRIARRVVWIGPSVSEDPEVAARHDATRAVQARVLPGLGVTFFDPRAWQVGVAGEHAPDGTHFTRAAYKAQAREIAQRISGPSWGWWAAAAAGAALAVGIGYAASAR